MLKHNKFYTLSKYTNSKRSVERAGRKNELSTDWLTETDWWRCTDTQVNVVDKLLRAIANIEYEASQREAALTLSHLCHSADDDDAQLINERIQLVAGPYLHQLILVCIMAFYSVK